MPDYSPRTFTLRKLTSAQLDNPILHLNLPSKIKASLYKRFDGKTKVVVTSISRLSPYAISNDRNMNLVSFYFKDDYDTATVSDPRSISYIASDIVLDRLLLNEDEVI